LTAPYVETQVKDIRDAGVVWVDSVAGHLICCNGDPNATRVVSEAVREFLQKLSAQKKPAR